MNQLPTLEELDLNYIQYIILRHKELREAAVALALTESTFYRIRRRHNMIGPLHEPITMTFEEFIRRLDAGMLEGLFRNGK